MTLPRYTSIGSYPLYYLSRLDEILCNVCASELKLKEHHGNVHWEGPSLECAYCQQVIESAYGRGEVADERDDNDLRESAE